MKLFKDILIEQKLERFEIPNVEEKIEIIKKWLEDYQHGTLKKDKEISRAQGFNQDFFLDILGYIKKPSEMYSFDPEYTIEGKHPDGVLGFFRRNKEDNVFAVVEHKDASTSLDKPQQREKNLTPIEQAFGYKRHLRKCPFVIVSNFYEIRLFNDNELDYEIWNLNDLIDSKNNYFNFKKFYYLLCAKNFITETGISNTESLLSEIKTEEEEITKKFYNDYKEKRLLLLRNIYAKNESIKNNPDLLIEKGQKIIDRVIFMCFCEDRGLLPVDTLQKIKADYKKSLIFSSSWDALKSAFNSVDKGNEKWGIPDGYNGGLFKYDEVLNDLIIEDQVLIKIIDFGEYDFKDEMSVNILGHIFEQSISELEEIKTKIEKKEEIIEENLKKTNKRKKDGIFYTPEYIVDYIVKNSLGSYLRENEIRILEEEKLSEDLKEEEYRKREQKAYVRYQDFLSKVKVLDPACGSGAFLVKVFDYLLEENQRVGKILGGLFNTDSIYKSILENNIYGVDLNLESVEITKLSLWLKSAQSGKKLNNLDNNIKCGNSLIDDEKIAGNKAFDWNKEFSEIMKNGGFDVIVGNPPYIQSRNLKEEERKYYWSKYLTNTNHSDIYSFFIEKAINLLKNYGILGFITPDTWLQTPSFYSLRKKILQECNITSILSLSKEKVFSDALVSTMVTVLEKKRKMKNLIEIRAKNDKNINLLNKIEQDTIDPKNGIRLFQDSKTEIILLKIFKETVSLSSVVEIIGGLRTGDDKKFLKNTEENKDCRKLLRGRNVRRYNFEWNNEWVWYKPDLMKIKQAAAPKSADIFESKEKLLVRMITGNNIIAAYDNQGFYFLQDNVILLKKLNLKYVLAILNSSLFGFVVKNITSNIAVTQSVLNNLPIKNVNEIKQKILISLVDVMLSLNKEFYEKISRFLERMKGNYKLEKPSEKIEKFYEFSFNDFVTEMRKKGAEVPLSTQDELEKYFDEYKKEILKLKSEIEKTDKKIDEEVYKIYGLKGEEIKVVEEK